MELNTRLTFLLQVTIGVIIIVVTLWFYWLPLSLSVKQISQSDDYSYGLLLPIVSGYIVYLKWLQIRRGPWQPSWMGLPFLVAGFALNIFGDLVGFLYLPTISFIVIIASLLLLLGGWKILRLFSFPLLLLFLMIPLPSVLMQQLTFKLQIISSALAAWLLQTVGIPCVRHGNVIDLGVRQLQVVDACSGLRYILSLLSLGIIYCYFYQRRLWKATLLIFSLIPNAIIANAIRVAAMALFPALQQEGFWHSFSGWLIFLFAFGFLALINAMLNYWRPDNIGGRTVDIPPETKTPDTRSARPSFTAFLLAALAIVIFFTLGASNLKTAPVPILQSFDFFPLQLGPWQGQRSYLDPAMAKRVGADAYFEANYSSPQNGPVSLWIAYFESQNQKIEGRIHSPLICLTGGGWKIIEDKIVEVAPGFSVKCLLMEQAGVRHVVYYWFLLGGRWISNDFSVRFFMGYDGIIRRRNDGALFRLITPTDQNIEAAKERLTHFTRLLIPMMPKFFRD